MADGAALPALPPDLPDIASARLPVAYADAQRALSRCYRIDECKNWADKAEAIASYAKQAQDDQLRHLATRIQARALRRCGQLLRDIPDNNRGRPSITEIRDGRIRNSRTAAANAAKLSERQRKTAIRIAVVPEEKFQEALDRDEPANVAELAEMGREPRPGPRADGIADAEAGTREHADRWPPGTEGHGDYVLGLQEVEQRGKRTPQEEEDIRAAARLLDFLGQCINAIAVIDVDAARRGLVPAARARAQQQSERLLYWLGALDV